MVRMFTNVKFSQALPDTASIEPPSSLVLAAPTGGGGVAAISSNYWRNKSLRNISLLEPFIFLPAGVSPRRLSSALPRSAGGVNYPSSSPRENLLVRHPHCLILNERPVDESLIIYFITSLRKYRATL